MTCYIEAPIWQEIESVPATGYAPFNFPPSGAYLPFHFTNEQFTKVLSALRVGAYVMYPDEALQVLWYFLQNVEFPVDMCDIVAQALLECEDVHAALATVISTNETVQGAVRDFVINDPEINDFVIDRARVSVITLEEQTANLLKPGECNFDFIFNQTTTLVDLLNSLSEDLLQALIVGTNPLERGQILLSAIPAIGAVIPFDEILAFANELVEDVQEEYQNKYDEALEDELRCGLFCEFRDVCDISISDAMLFYSNKASETLPADPLEALQATIQLFLAGVLPGNWVVYMMHLLVLACIQAGQDLVGVDFATMGIRIVAAGDEPNNDWMTICEDCPPEPETCETANASQDFRVNDGFFVPSHPEFNYAQWTIGLGWHTFPPANTFTISIEREFTEPVNMVKIYTNQPITGNLYIRTLRANGWSTLTPGVTTNGTEGTLYWYQLELADVTTGICYQVLAGSIPDDFAIVRACEWWEEV